MNPSVSESDTVLIYCLLFLLLCAIAYLLRCRISMWLPLYPCHCP